VRIVLPRQFCLPSGFHLSVPTLLYFCRFSGVRDADRGTGGRRNVLVRSRRRRGHCPHRKRRSPP
jgi:hypothetical protein